MKAKGKTTVSIRVFRKKDQRWINIYPRFWKRFLAFIKSLLRK